MNYYEVLKISNNASLSEIKKAYNSLVKRYHPDIYEGSKLFAESKIKEINEAYSTLKNKNKKQIYDANLSNGILYNTNIKNSVNNKKIKSKEKNLYMLFQKYVNKLEKSYNIEKKEDIIVISLICIIFIFSICIIKKL